MKGYIKNFKNVYDVAKIVKWGGVKIMFIRPIKYRSFMDYGTTIRSVDDLTVLAEYDYSLIKCDDDSVIMSSENTVYIEPANGIGLLTIIHNNVTRPFVFARPVSINAGVEFCVLSYGCDFSYYMYSKGSFKKRKYDILSQLPSNSIKLFVDKIYTFLYMEENKNFIFKGERHPYWELMYVDTGELTCIVEGDTFRLKQGNLILYQPDEYHAISATGNGMVSFLNIAFDLKGADPAMGKRIYHIDQEVHDILKTMIWESEKLDSYSVDFIEANLKLLLLRLIRGENASNQTSKIYSTTSVSDHNQLIEIAKQFIEENLTSTDLSVKRLAEILNISTSYLYRVFMESLGISVQTYINDEKFRRAKEFIAEGEMNISEIAAELNFCSSTYFSSKFKERFGVTPREYSRKVFQK